MHKSGKQEGIKGPILLGASLGPVFTTCSPTYALILAIVLPQSFALGIINLIVFALGTAIPLLIIGYGGQKVVSKLRGAANPKGWFKRGLGVLLILSGIAIFTGLDKDFEAYLISKGFLGALELEQSILEDAKN